MELKPVIAVFKGVNEFLGDLVEAVKDTTWPAAVSKAVPWLGPLGEGLADSVAPIRFVVKLYDAAVRIDDPNKLGEIACTVAFQRSVQQSLSARSTLPDKTLGTIAREAAEELRSSKTSATYDFTTMTLDRATQEPFFIDARNSFQKFLDLAGVDESARNTVLTDVELRIAYNLELLVTNRDTKDKFEPFYRLLVLDRPEQRAYRALRQHAAYQRWMYEERRILREEPYALQHIYVGTDCGDLKWKDFEQRRKDRTSGKTQKPEINPFWDKPDHGGRHDLVNTVMRHLSDPSFRDLIVIQGPAGSGKSSLTLRVSQELMSQGLLPIRIELKHLDTAANRHVRDTLPEAVRLADEDFDPSVVEYVHREGLFLDDAIFGQTGTLNGTEICRYVLILDAWDEISVGAEEGYQQHVERLLKEIRETYLDKGRWKHPIRIILTGRPTEAVTQGKLLRDETRLLTLRYFTVNQLEQFHQQVGAAVAARPIRSPGWMSWNIPTKQALGELRNQYRKYVEEEVQARKERRDHSYADSAHSTELLGSPLLGLLSLRLLSQWPGDPKALFNSPTVLYRSLVDLLLGGGKVAAERPGDSAAHVVGRELRDLLWSVAEATTVLSREALPKAELLKRVKTAEGSLDARVKQLIDANKLSRLLVSFFFHGGRREQGCEFSHKSFREYLFAECVVEELKNYAREAKPLPERDISTGYWRDFEKHDPRYDFARRMAKLLGPQWLTQETGRHISELVEWEFLRAIGKDPFPAVRGGEPTDPLPVVQWPLLRDTLADLWDWWGEGVHLRSQPYEGEDSPLKWAEPLAMEVAKSDRMLSGQIADIRPPRITTVDSHLGDGLFQLCCDVHRVLNDDESIRVPGAGERRHQSVSETKVRFRPSGPGNFWRNYWHRIESAGYRWRFRGNFPEGINLASIDWTREDLRGVSLQGASLARADLVGVNLTSASLKGSNLAGANLAGANLASADLFAANLTAADLQRATLTDANLSGTKLEGAILADANLGNANLGFANLKGADLSRAHLGGANLMGAKVGGTNFAATHVSNEQLRATTDDSL